MYVGHFTLEELLHRYRDSSNPELSALARAAEEAITDLKQQIADQNTELSREINRAMTEKVNWHTETNMMIERVRALEERIADLQDDLRHANEEKEVCEQKYRKLRSVV
jgi:flagellar biosynthesis chaperone FliJ